MRLDSRLQCIADRVKKGSYPADIGTDHAYIPIYLVEKGICRNVVGTDIKDGPLKRAEKNIKLHNLEDRIMLKKGSGLAPVDGMGIDCAIMAGMGGFLICSMLEESKRIADSIDFFLLQPMQEPDAVRKYLYENNYNIYDETLVKDDDKLYEVMSVMHGSMSVDDEIYFEIGKKLIENKDPLLEEFIGRKIYEAKKVISLLSKKDSPNARARLHECEIKLNKFQEVKRCL